MDLEVEIPSTSRYTKLDIEAFKRSIHAIEEELSERYKKCQPETSSLSLSPLCSKCAVVGDRLETIIINAKNNANPRNAIGRHSTDNIFLGTMHKILSEEACALCSLIAKGFIRAKRRELFRRLSYTDELRDSLSVQEIAQIFLEGMDDRSPSPEEHDSPLAVQLSLESLVRDGTLALWWPRELKDTNDEHIQLRMVTEDHQALFEDQESMAFLPNLLNYTKRDLEMFRECFNACLHNHTECRRNRTKNSGPRRLIDVEEMKIYRAASEDKLPYFALSYVWGRSPFLALRKANEKVLAERGSLITQEIPRTISDAIGITQTFGYRYLWVDSLCILQDDHKDKLHEINNMCDIYAAADMTLVAAAGADSYADMMAVDVLFQDHEPHSINGYRFTLDAWEMGEVVEFSTWCTRGWTFQELVLSRRLLYFCPERTYFSCSARTWSEDCPLSGSISKEVYDRYFLADDPKAVFDYFNTADSFEKYATMIEKISVREFTKSEDILRACQGFYVELLQMEFGSSVCGLPSTCFEFALAWQPDGNLKRRIVDDGELPFPSWSWAGWVGPIRSPLFSGPKKLEIYRLISWTIYIPTSFADSVNSPSTASDPVDLMKCFLPARFTNTDHVTKWESQQFPLEGESLEGECTLRYGTRQIRFSPDSYDRKNTLPSFVERGILIFRTKSITCPIRATSFQYIAPGKSLELCSLFHNDEIIGEIKIDYPTLARNRESSEFGLFSVELISLFRMDFAGSAMQNIFELSANSTWGHFSSNFVKMINERQNKNVYIVMWIGWKDRIAYRVAVGYVTVEDFDAMEPVDKLIILG